MIARGTLWHAQGNQSTLAIPQPPSLDKVHGSRARKTMLSTSGIHASEAGLLSIYHGEWLIIESRTILNPDTSPRSVLYRWCCSRQKRIGPNWRHSFESLLGMHGCPSA